MQPLQHFEGQTRHGRGGAIGDRAAVIGVRGGDEVIVRLELHIAVPYARHQRPLRREVPGPLRVLVDVVDDVILIAT